MRGSFAPRIFAMSLALGAFCARAEEGEGGVHFTPPSDPSHTQEMATNLQEALL